MKKPIKLGIVGLGRAGMSMHLEELADKWDMFEIVAVCDVESDRCERVSKKHNCKIYKTIEELVEDPDVEVVDIATRSCDHYKHAKTALEAGKIVFLEKPMTQSYKEAKNLFEIAEKNGERRLFIRHNRRFEEKFTEVNRIIASGILGEVYLIKLARSSYDQRCDWQTLSQYGGGQLLNWGPHIIDHSLRFCGGEYERMSAVTRQIAAAGDCEDFIQIVFEGKNGRVVNMEISGGTAMDVPEYILYGSRGTLYDNGDTYTLNCLPEDFVLPKVVADCRTPGTVPHTPHGASFTSGNELPFERREIPWEWKCENNTWKALYDHLRNGIDYPIKSEEALKVMEVITNIKEDMDR